MGVPTSMGVPSMGVREGGIMDEVGTRRGFLHWTNSALAALGFAGTRLEAASTTRPVEGEDYYDKLGVAKIINAAGTYTALTASIMPPAVTGHCRTRGQASG